MRIFKSNLYKYIKTKHRNAIETHLVLALIGQ